MTVKKRQKTGRPKPGRTWYKVVPYPAGIDEYSKKQMFQAFEEMEFRTPPVCWTQDREEARVVARAWDLQDRPCEIFEQDWNPLGAFWPVFEHKPDPKRAVEGLKVVLK
jgi:hypothetical protein